jgi:hypothetical protein
MGLNDDTLLTQGNVSSLSFNASKITGRENESTAVDWLGEFSLILNPKITVSDLRILSPGYLCYRRCHSLCLTEHHHRNRHWTRVRHAWSLRLDLQGL